MLTNLNFTKAEIFLKTTISKLKRSKNYRKWDHYAPPFLSPEFKQDENSSEVYTPSFDHKNEIDFQKQSPLSLINQFKDVSAQKTAEPPYLRKRRNKFKQRAEETPYIGQIMVNNEGQHILQPLYSQGPRGVSLPPPVPIGRSVHEDMDDEEDKEPNDVPYYPTCH